MRHIDGQLPEKMEEFLAKKTVAESDGFEASNFKNLVELCASISYLNKDHLIFYRGQNTDYKNKAGKSTFYPTIYRGDPLRKRELDYRFSVLNDASRTLKRKFQEHKIEGHSELKRKKLIQWSILQHYEVCETPLMDFTQSLRVAASFALLKSKNKHAYIYAFGLPYLTNRISTNSEHDLINIRLLSICPPLALRPYYQEGYVVATDDIENEYDDKTELDFNRRLIAKFKIPNRNSFWGKDFSPIPDAALYPKNDTILKLSQEIMLEINVELESGDIGEFLKSWAKLETHIMRFASDQKHPHSISFALRQLRSEEELDSLVLNKIDMLRRFRNTLVHSPTEVSSKLIKHHIENLDEMRAELKIK